MNRKQRMIASYRAIASKALDANLEYSTTFTLVAMVLAMEKAHCKVNWDKWFAAYAEIYPQVLHDPITSKERAEEITGCEIDIRWTE